MRTGRIYKIISAEGNEIYIGSTLNTLRDCFQHKKRQYKQFRVDMRDEIKNSLEHSNNNSNNNNNDDDDEKYKLSPRTLFWLFEKYGLEKCKIILIKEYQVVDRLHMIAYEKLWRNRLKSINHLSFPF